VEDLLVMVAAQVEMVAVDKMVTNLAAVVALVDILDLVEMVGLDLLVQIKLTAQVAEVVVIKV
jgi:hypothetical protein